MFVPNKTTNQMKITKKEAQILADAMRLYKKTKITLSFKIYEELTDLEDKLNNYPATKILKNQIKQDEQTTN
jgi:hypothetical protein